MGLLKPNTIILRILIGVSLLGSLIIPGVAQAQTPVPPPPPPQQRLQLPRLNSPELPGTSLQPNAALSGFFPWSRLAFQSYRDGNWEIYTSRDDGSQETRLTTNKAVDMQPRINPGAKRIAFASKRDGNYEIYTMAMDGSGLKRLTNNTWDDVGPAWSPDGKKIAYESYRYHNADVFVMNADGSGQTRLTTDSANEGMPGWSPDGSKIIYINTQSVFTMNANGSGQAGLVYFPYASNPIWSRDGSQIVLQADANSDGYYELWTYNPTTTARQMIRQAPGGCDDWTGSWSPDGRYLAFTEICYIYQNNTWYWTSASLGAWDSLDPNATPILLDSGSSEWNPDWGSTDAIPPVTTTRGLPSISSTYITLNWVGTDAGGSGMMNYDVEVKDGLSATWTRLLTQSTNTSISYRGYGAHTYYFRVRGRDFSFNTEAWPADFSAMTTVETLPPIIFIKPLPPYARGNILVSWGGIDPGGSGIAWYNVQYKYGNSTSLFPWQTETLATSAVLLNGVPGVKYCFVLSASDNANNYSPPVGGTGNSCVTFYSWQFSGLVHDITGAPVSGVHVALLSAAINKPVSDSGGNFIVYGTQNILNNTASWTKSGYGSLPDTPIAPGIDSSIEVTLPPPNDVMRDSSFEAGALAADTWQSTGTNPAGPSKAAFHNGQWAMRLGQSAWEPEQTINALQYDSNGVPEPHLVFDNDGTAHAIWWVKGIFIDQGVVYYASKPANGSWSTPLDLTGNGYYGKPEIAVDSAGTIYVAWAGNGSGYRTKPKGGNWSIKTPMPNGPFKDVHIAVDGMNNMHVAGVNLGNSVVYQMLKANGLWTPMEVLETNGLNPILALDVQNTVHILWARNVSEGEQLMYAYKTKDGDWSAAVQIQAVPYALDSPSLAVDDTGNIYVIFKSSLGLTLLEKQAGADWGQPEIIPVGDYYGKVAIALEHNRIGIAYTSADPVNGGQEFLIEKSTGGTWSLPVQISIQGHMGVNPALAAEPDGRFGVVWVGSIILDFNTQIIHAEINFSRQIAADTEGDAVLSQTVTLPETLSNPRLAFYYQLQNNIVPTNGSFMVAVQPAQGDEVDLFSTQVTANAWTFKSIDMSTWSGQTITLRFKAHQGVGELVTYARLDDVTLGSAYPDVWVTASDVNGRPGKEVIFNIACGNQGGVTASGASLAVILPAGLTFVSAEPAPADPTTATLTWDLGDLAPHSNACQVALTATIDPSVTIPHSLAADVEITSNTTELEVENNGVHPAADVPYYLVYVPNVQK